MTHEGLDAEKETGESVAHGWEVGMLGEDKEESRRFWMVWSDVLFASLLRLLVRCLNKAHLLKLFLYPHCTVDQEASLLKREIYQMII